MIDSNHWFWWILTAAAVTWYILITGYVAARGVLDIRSMLRNLTEKGAAE